MKTAELRDNAEIKKWFSRINASAATKQAYFQGMQAYTEMTGKTPEELILEAEAEVRAGHLMRERTIVTYLTDFRELQESKSLAPLTIKSRVSGVCSFYKSNQIELPVLPKNMQKARPLKKHRYIPEKEDIQAILKFCDPLERALILVGASSGLAAAEISNLKVADFRKGYDEKTKITVLHVTRTKENDYEFHSCLSPEATMAVDAYLDYRNRIIETEDEERQNQLRKQRIESNDGYLFVSRAVPNEYLTFTDKTKSKKANAILREELRKLEPPGIMAILRRLSEKAQKTAPTGEWNLIRTHNLRRFFNSTLLNAGASVFMVDYLMGHVLDSTHDAYYRGNPQRLRELYSEYIHLLTINKETDEELMQKYEEEVKKAKALETDVVRMAIERTELQDMREQLEEANKRIIDVENDYRALQADYDLATTITLHDQEEMEKSIIAKVMASLSGSQERIKKNLKSEPIDPN